ncbi:MAG: FtsW/RodA/SpoVE family cell cycle protein [Cellulosilyticum sp.]|nr:FtsW/RodA/SpoVE family cell cycle protein [Cellulosilyticum sp.]
MNQYVDDFLKKVLEQVRYRKIHPFLAYELNDHIECLKDDYMEEGMREEEAYRKAVAQMGDAECIGEELHRMHKPHMEWSILALVLGLLGIGVFILSIYFSQYMIGESEINFFAKHLICIGLSSIGFFVMYFLDYQRLDQYTHIFYGIGIGTLIAVEKIGLELNGMKRFIQIGPISIQGAVLAVTFFILAGVGYVRRYANKGIKGYIRLGILGSIAVYLVGRLEWILALILVGVLSVTFIAYIISTEYKRNKKRVLICTGSIFLSVLLGTTLMILGSDYRMERLKAWINPNLDPMGDGYTIARIRTMCEQAEFIGSRGIESVELFYEDIGSRFFPIANAISDYSFNFIIGKMGTLVAFIVALVVGVLIIRCFKSISRIREAYGRLLAISIITYLGSRFIVSIGSSMGLIPGHSSMPFVSYGSSYLIMDMILMGLFLSIYRRKDICPENLIKMGNFTDDKINRSMYTVSDKSWQFLRHVLMFDDENEDIEMDDITFDELENQMTQREMIEKTVEFLQESDEVESIQVVFKKD